MTNPEIREEPYPDGAQLGDQPHAVDLLDRVVLGLRHRHVRAAASAGRALCQCLGPDLPRHVRLRARGVFAGGTGARHNEDDDGKDSEDGPRRRGLLLPPHGVEGVGGRGLEEGGGF